MSQKILHVTILLLATFLLFSCNREDDEAYQEGWQVESVLHEDLHREFRYYLPERRDHALPVVIVLHGGGGSMDKIIDPSFNGIPMWGRIADDEGIMVISPNGTHADTGSPSGNSQRWNDCRPFIEGRTATADDVGFMAALLDWLETHFSQSPVQADLDRIYVTGVSNGGMMAYRLAAEMPHRIAGIASFIANMPEPSICPEANSSIPVLIMNGTEDALMPFEGGNIPGGRGGVRSAEATKAYWLAVNGLQDVVPQIFEYPDRDPNDGSVVICEEYLGDTPRRRLQFCTVAGGGHTMPSIEYPASIGRQNQDIEGAQVAWEFFNSRH